MTKDEAIKKIEEYLQDADKAFSEDEEYIRGWKSAFLIALKITTKIDGKSETPDKIPAYPCIACCSPSERAACCGCPKERQWQERYGKCDREVRECIG